MLSLTRHTGPFLDLCHPAVRILGCSRTSIRSSSRPLRRSGESTAHAAGSVSSPAVAGGCVGSVRALCPASFRTASGRRLVDAAVDAGDVSLASRKRHASGVTHG